MLATACGPESDGVGAPCSLASDCGDLQCFEGTCQPRCQRAPDCGDGYACDADGRCLAGEAQSGDRCASEVECAPGLACRLDIDDGGDGVLEATCSPDHGGAPTGAGCAADADCRNGTCALGLCVDVCVRTRDCSASHMCTAVPRVDNAAAEPSEHGMFNGCLPAAGTLTYTIDLGGPSDAVYLPVPGNARSALAVMSVDDENQYVGASELIEPGGDVIYTLDPEVFDPFDPTNQVRHTPTLASSVMMIPSSPARPLVPGAYRLELGTFVLDDSSGMPRLDPGTATPTLQAVVKLGEGAVLDLHFYFLDLTEHPCADALGPAFDAAAAEADGSAFQTEFMDDAVSLIFARAGIAIGAVTYDDLHDVPQFDGLRAQDLPELLRLADHEGGVNVFFVRTIAPVGLQILVGGDKNPGDPMLGPRDGVVVSVDTLCYRSWKELGRLAVHAIARQMGLFRNVEPPPFDTFADLIDDSPDTSDPMAARRNLMNFSEFGGTELSPGQEEILLSSAVLR